MTLSTHAALAKDKRHATGKINTMQHRHYAIIAGILKQVIDNDTQVRMVELFARKLGEDNPNFDHLRFLRACGLVEV